MIAILNNNISFPIKILTRHSWIVVWLFVILSINGLLFVAESTGQTSKQPPETKITNAPQTSIYEKNTFTFKFEGTDAKNKQDLTYSWRLDYKEWSPFSPEKFVLLKDNVLTVGMHRFQVRAKDKDGNIGTPAEALFKVIPDLQPPETTITTKVPDLIKRNYFTFQFEGDDGQTPKDKLQYSWRIDLGKWSEFSPQTSVYLSNLSDGVHSFEVKARDASGNEDATPAKVSFEVTKQEPDTIIIDPPEIVEASDVTFRFSGEDLQTPREKLEYSWRLDNQKWTPFSTETIANLTNLSNGMHQFEVKAKDEDGNEDATYAKAVFKVSVNIEFPNTEITQKNSEPGGNFTFQFKGTDLQTPDKLWYAWRVGEVNKEEDKVDYKGWPSFALETTAHLSGLTEGRYRFQVKAKDADGNEDPTPAEESFEVTAEKTPETTITNAPVEPLKTSEYTFYFKATNLQSPIQYSWCLDGGKWSEFSNETSVTIKDLENGVHLFQVKAKDAEGNETPTSAEAIFEVKKPIPEVSIINAPDSPLKQRDFTFQFRVTNLQTPVQYSWRLDRGEWSEFSEDMSVTVRNLTDGTHLFQVKARDAKGNETPTSAEARFEVKKQFPEVIIINVPDAPLRQSDFTFQFRATNLQTPVQYSWRLDGGKWSEFSSATSYRWENLTNGTHLFQARAKDTDGNVSSTPAEASFIVATPAPPETEIITKIDGPIKFNSYTFEFSSTTQQVSYSWRLDGGEWSEYKTTPKVKIENLTNGRHILEVKAMDDQGRVDETPAQLLFAVDEQAPQVFIEKFPDPVQTATYTFNLRGNDPQNPPAKLQYSWKLDERDWTPFSQKQVAVTENLTDGKHILRARCKDPDGNISPEVVISFNVKVDVPIIKDLDTYLGILKHSQLTLTLRGQDLQTPSDQLEYSYKLDEKEWSVYSKESTISLHDLKQGEHALYVKVRDTDEYESQLYKVNFSVNLPLYQRRPFWSVVGVVAIVGISVLAATQINLYRKRRYALKTKYNPYTAGDPIMEENRFFGRAEFLREIKASIHNTNFIIMGDNRIGKTSVLYRLTDELRTMGSKEYLYLPFLIDISDVMEEDKLFEKLLMETRRQVSEYDLEIDFDSIFKKEDDSFYRLQFTIDSILKKLEEKGTGGRQIRLIFMLDECDALNDLGRKVKSKIRSIFTQRYAQNVSAILTGVSINLDPERTSPWWNPFKIKLMTPFTDEEARALIKKPAGKIYHFEDKAIDAILNWSEKNPYLVQLLCHEAVNMAISDRRLTITEDNIQTVISLSQKAKAGIRKAPTEEEIKKQIEKSFSVGLFS
ncbi:hypothetical protein FJZ31_21760 [Candidatus Poribacteria bacterium]|nr:hypothetical protein [Candidatus Poribacteria bacterium]